MDYKKGVKSTPIWHGLARYYCYFMQLDDSCHFMTAKSKMGVCHRSPEINHERVWITLIQKDRALPRMIKRQKEQQITLKTLCDEKFVLNSFVPILA